MRRGGLGGGQCGGHRGGGLSASNPESSGGIMRRGGQ